MNKDIFIILPYKESLNFKKAGAVSIYVKDAYKFSKYKTNFFINDIEFQNKYLQDGKSLSEKLKELPE